MSADVQAGELSARGASERRNLLALNLADEVAAGGREAQAARRFYDRTLRLAAAGKSSGCMQSLLFEPYAPVPPGKSW